MITFAAQFIESVEHKVINYCFMIQLKIVQYCVMNDPRLLLNALQTYEPAQHSRRTLSCKCFIRTYEPAQHSKMNTFLHAEHAT